LSATPGSTSEKADRFSAAAVLYLDLLKRSLTGLLSSDEAYLPGEESRAPFDLERRLQGRDWPVTAETMIGLARLDNLESCVTHVIRDRVPGDLIETGVWRGGAAILMRAVLEAYGDTERQVWVADSFAGLPRPDADRYPADAGDSLWTHPELAVSLDEVKRNFAKYGLLGDRIRFLAGWFRDTLPTAPIERLAVLRLDGDLYESTMVGLTALYPKVSPGGFVIVDDYALETCRAAVDDYRAEHGIVDDIHVVDWTGVYWRKSAADLERDG
jgi:O-methyltransferase